MSSRVFLATGYVALAVTVAWTALHGRPAAAPVLAHSLPAVAAGRGAPVVAIVLHPQDCAGRIEALAAWNELHRSGLVKVVGLVSGAGGGPDALERIRRGVGIEFPLRSTSRAEVHGALRALNYRSTPMAVLLDAGNRVRSAVPLSEADARSAVEVIAAQARLLGEPRQVRRGPVRPLPAQRG
ncbi:MAG TPA: hypothetical protein VF746_12565 [Longimicrobium sp.]